MDGDDITERNESMPWYPKGLPLWQRVLCLLGYHKPEIRMSGKDMPFPGLKLRDQCGRCKTLL